jgi:cytochrome c oxidase subunit II
MVVLRIERSLIVEFGIRKYRRVLPLTSFLVILLAVLGYGMQEPVKSENKDGGERKVKKVNIVAERFSFTPSQIKVKAGTTLEIILSSEDTFHGFRVPSANINEIIPARGRGNVKITFDAKEKGRYPFECSRPCGAGHTMMRGVIIVE